MKTGRYNLKELLTHYEIDQIIIPEIQRDYVWQIENVSKLVHSILNRFQNKTENKIIFYNSDGSPIDNSVFDSFLQLKYSQLNNNIKIGFIYAYHDNEYANKFFLIDGQQRITTLYLLLLCLYKKAGKQSEFRNLYFKDKQLKVDYKVREASHDFMIEFVENQLSKLDNNIKESSRYYTEYESDTTIQNVIQNYKCIEDLLDKDSNSEELLRFVEEFVEVNYFDTNISQQGETLYLYMNSRGESLSFQELIKAEIIKKIRSKEKLEEVEKKKIAGKLWEDWQNFFWKYRVYNKNENADIGFQEFLKWATLIQICTSDDTELLESKTVKDRGIERPQTLRETKENYIHIHRDKDRIKEQNDILSNYQLKANSFDMDYLEGVFNALKLLYSYNSHYVSLKKEWLANNISTIDYVILCPLLYFVSNSEWDNAELKQREIERLSMFLKNIAYFQSTLGKSPDNATIDALDLVKDLCKAKKTDIAYLLDKSFKEKYKTILTDAERVKLQILINQEKSNDVEVKREDLEKFIWDITLSEDISKFLEGDISILFDCVNNECPELTEQMFYSSTHLNELRNYYPVLTNVIFNHRKDDLLRRALLTFGNYWSYYSGSDLLKPWMGKYTLVQNDPEWRYLFQDSKNKIIIMSFMKDMKQHVNADIKSALKNLCTNYPKNDWKEPFIKNKELLKYCGIKKMLQRDSRIVLLSQINAGACEIQTMLLKLKFDKAFTHSHNVCVIDFNIVDGIWTNLDKDWNKSDRYALDINYENSDWHFSILYRTDGIDKQKLALFESSEDWELIVTDRLRARKIDNLLHTDDPSKSILENVEEVYQRILNLQTEVIALLTETQEEEEEEEEVTIDSTL